MPGTCATQTSRSRARPVTPQNAQQRGGAGEEVFQGHVPSLQHGQGWWTLEIPAFFLGTWRPEYGHWLPSRRHFPVSSVTTTNTEPPSSRVTATHTAARGHRRPRLMAASDTREDSWCHWALPHTPQPSGPRRELICRADPGPLRALPYPGHWEQGPGHNREVATVPLPATGDSGTPPDELVTSSAAQPGCHQELGGPGKAPFHAHRDGSAGQATWNPPSRGHRPPCL